MVVAGGPALGLSYLTLMSQPMAAGRKGARLLRRQKVLQEDHRIGRELSKRFALTFGSFGVCDRRGLCGRYTLICSGVFFSEPCEVNILALTDL